VQGHSDPNQELLDAAALCRQLVRDGSVEAFLADHRRQLFPDEMFADLFPSGVGRPSVPADVVASAMVLQALEGLSDRDAARAVTDRISWKVACGLALDDAGFDYSVLAYWRARLRKSEHPERIFDAVRAVVDATGVLKGKARRALDSTLLDDAVATQDTVTQLIAAVRRARRVVPGAAGVPVAAHDYESAGKPVIAWDDPLAKAALVDGLVKDALAILGAVAAQPEGTEAAGAVGLLALVAGQDVEQADDGTWRVAEKVAPDRVISVVDPEARHMHKSVQHYRDGYKAHIAVEPETGILTAVELTPANAADAPVGVAMLDGERPGLQVLADSAYGSGEALAALRQAGHRRAIKPHNLLAAVPGGFDRDDFVVDHRSGTVTCPAGQVAKLSAGRRATFGALCQGCSLRERCTKALGGRKLRLHPHDEDLVESRRAWREGDFAEDYRRFRPMVERAVAWLVANGRRRCRYRGVEANKLGLSLRAAALNLRRLVNLGLTRKRGKWKLQLA
jgi:IS5 family transposase